MPRRTIQVGAVRAEIYPWRHPSGRDYWRWDYFDHQGTRRQVTGSTVERLRDLIGKKLRELGGETPLPRDLPPSIRTRLARILDVDPHLELFAEFLDWKQARHPDIRLREAKKEFLAAKENTRGLSTRNLASLRGDLGDLSRHFPQNPLLSSITVADLEAWLATHQEKSAKRRLNLRASAVTLFRWCRRRRYLPHELSAAEVLDRPKVQRKIPPTYTPAQMRRMLDACPAPYLPWLLFSAFAGVRYEEICPPRGSDKSPLAWSDLHGGLLIVRPETAKLGERRVIDLPAGLLEMLPADRSGPLIPARPVHKRVQGGSITEILGKAAGTGWLTNGLRNSFISYRAAVVGLAQAALEAGNSEREARKSYNDAKSREEGEAWFALLGG